MKYLFIAVCLLFLLPACHKSHTSSGTVDTAFNGSYFQVSYNGHNYYSKDAVADSQHIVIMSVTSSLNFSSAAAGPYCTSISISAGGGEYGLTSVLFNVYGDTTGVGSYKFVSAAEGHTSQVIQTSPYTTFTDTSGTVTITYSGFDYTQGTFTTTLFDSAGASYAATGSFKIYNQ